VVNQTLRQIGLFNKVVDLGVRAIMKRDCSLSRLREFQNCTCLLLKIFGEVPLEADIEFFPRPRR
jgi:hypothetical protein